MHKLRGYLYQHGWCKGMSREEPGIESIRCDTDGVWIGQVVPKKIDGPSIDVQRPYRESVGGENVKAIETMGVRVQVDRETDTVTVANTSTDTDLSSRFAAFDVSLIDDVIQALEEMQDRFA